MMGWIKTNTGAFDLGYFIMGGMMFAAALLVLTIKYGFSFSHKNEEAAEAVTEH